MNKNKDSPSTDSKSSETGVVYQAGGYEDHLPVVTNGQEHGEGLPSIDSNDRSKDSLPVVTNGQEHGGGSPSIDNNHGSEDNLPVVTSRMVKNTGKVQLVSTAVMDLRTDLQSSKMDKSIQKVRRVMDLRTRSKWLQVESSTRWEWSWDHGVGFLVAQKKLTDLQAGVA